MNAPKLTKGRFVRWHGLKAHHLIEISGGDMHMACGLILTQTRAALTRDKTCKNCTRELRLANRLVKGSK